MEKSTPNKKFIAGVITVLVALGTLFIENFIRVRQEQNRAAEKEKAKPAPVELPAQPSGEWKEFAEIKTSPGAPATSFFASNPVDVTANRVVDVWTSEIVYFAGKKSRDTKMKWRIDCNNQTAQCLVVAQYSTGPQYPNISRNIEEAPVGELIASNLTPTEVTKIQPNTVGSKLAKRACESADKLLKEKP